MHPWRPRVLRALRGMRRFQKRARSLPPKAVPPKNAAAVAANPVVVRVVVKALRLPLQASE